LVGPLSLLPPIPTLPLSLPSAPVARIDQICGRHLARAPHITPHSGIHIGSSLSNHAEEKPLSEADSRSVLQEILNFLESEASIHLNGR